ncbi:MAG TPA: ABC transporter substrate-binding protein [Rubrivivax sp.]|nr:ABC transporter substrate-binding protein [Rubrivivax sp.]HPO17604.1 ABC transporter substrate-binding protein [Rubrivivax sp.]
MSLHTSAAASLHLLLALASIASLDVHAQAASRERIVGCLSYVTPDAPKPCLDGLRKGLAQAGWVEGRTFRFEVRYAGGKPELLAPRAAELVALHPDVLATSGLPSTVALQQATRELPIVVLSAGGMQTAGLIATLDRPGGNVTGQSFGVSEHGMKTFDILLQAFPNAKRIGVILNSRNPVHSIDPAGAALVKRQGRELEQAWIEDACGIDAAWDALAARGVGAVVINPDLGPHMPAHARAAIRLGLPAISHHHGFVENGGLMSYGLGPQESICRKGARYVHEVLEGRRPQDLPVEEMRDAELVINMKAARALKVNLPADILTRAAELIDGPAR